jgi:hypothetical protein
MTGTSGPLDEQWLLTMLTDLGHSADEIAVALQAAKITGRRYDSRECPIARYITRRARQIMPFTYISVAVGHHISMRVEVFDQDPYWVNITRPAAVDAFIHAFHDDGAYPELTA